MAPASKRAPASDDSGSSSEEESASDSESINGAGGQQQADEEKMPEIDIDVTSLNPLSPEVIQKQATINIGALRCLAGARLCETAVGGGVIGGRRFG